MTCCACMMIYCAYMMAYCTVVSSGGAPTPAGTSVWEWGICGLMGGAVIT